MDWGPQTLIFLRRHAAKLLSTYIRLLKENSPLFCKAPVLCTAS